MAKIVNGGGVFVTTRDRCSLIVIFYSPLSFGGLLCNLLFIFAFIVPYRRKIAICPRVFSIGGGLTFSRADGGVRRFPVP